MFVVGVGAHDDPLILTYKSQFFKHITNNLIKIISYITEEKTMELNGVNFDTYFNNYPDKNGYFGKYGGVYIDDKLKAAMAEITEAYFSICQSRKFIAELRRIRKEFQGRPTPVSHLERLSDALGGKVQLYAKREDLNHSGAHKLNH